MTDNHLTQATLAPDDTSGATSRRRADRVALLHTSVLAAALVVASGVVLVVHLRSTPDPHGGPVPWSILASCFVLSEFLVVHIDVHREAISFSLSEIPLTLALFFASPFALIVRRLVGEAVRLAYNERQQPAGPFVEKNPWPTLTLGVSMDAIFRSTFVMIGRNRPAAFQQAKADHDYQEERYLLAGEHRPDPCHPRVDRSGPRAPAWLGQGGRVEASRTCGVLASDR